MQIPSKSNSWYLPAEEAIKYHQNIFQQSFLLLQDMLLNKCYIFPLLGDIIAWGGSPKPHSDAMEDSWKHILAFLSQHVGRKMHNSNHLSIKSAL